MDRLRPLGVGGLIDAGIKIYTSRWRTLVTAVGVVTVPVLLLSALVQVSAGSPTGFLRTNSQTGTASFEGRSFGIFLASTLIVSLLGVVANAIATAAAFRAVSGAYLGDDPDWHMSLRFARERFRSVLLVVVLTSLATLLGVLACGIGLFWALGVFSVAMPVLLVEDARGRAALGRSRRLVKGRFWPVLGVVLLSTIMTTFIQGAIAAPAIALVLTHSNHVLTVGVQTFGNMVGVVLVTPFTAAVTMALYVDLRIRKEGFDLMLLAQRLGTGMPAGGFPHQPGPVETVPVWGGAPPGPPGPPPGGAWWRPSPTTLPPPPAPPPPGPAWSPPGPGSGAPDDPRAR